MDISDMFTVTPMSQTIELVAGEEYTGRIVVANPASAKSDFTYRVTASVYNVRGEEYEADFLTESEQSQIVKWIEIKEPTGTLKPNETREVEFTIKVPENAPAGGQYAALMVGSAGSGASNGSVTVNNIYEMASIIYANVDGETVREGEIISNSFPGFVTSLPITTRATVKNDGNVHEKARVTVRVKDFFSSNMIYPENNETGTIEEVVMPYTTREIIREVDDLSSLGVYEVSQIVQYMGETFTESHTVIVCPIWFMVLVAVTVGAIGAAITYAIRRHRRKKVLI